MTLRRQTEHERFVEEGRDAAAGMFFWIRHSLDMTQTLPEFRQAWRDLEDWYWAAKMVTHGVPVAEAKREAAGRRADGQGEDFATREGHLEVLRGGEGWELISTTKPIVEIRDGELRPVEERKP